MNRDEATRLVEEAINLVVKNDLELLDLNVTERSLSHKLAHYMSLSKIIQPPLNVDCEYNRHFKDPKKLILPKREALDREVRATTVFPDIVVHERNSDDHNLIVLEMKKPDESIEYDEFKLKAFRRDLGYQHTAHVILGQTRAGQIIRKISWVD